MKTLAWAIAALGLLARPAMADIFVLANDGRIVGEAVEEKQAADQYIVRTLGGALVTLARAQVKEVIPQTAAEMAYEQIRDTYPDTIEGQWALAEWCRENHAAAREAHLRRILQLDTNHQKARAALGYSNYDGVWMTQDEWFQRRGYVRYAGRWRLPQEVELLERSERIELEEQQWKRKLARLREALVSNDARAVQAREEIAGIRDPSAVSALAEAMQGERLRPPKLLYIEALRNIGTPQAYYVLVQRSLTDRDEEVRLSCLDQLVDHDLPDALNFYIQALKNKDNATVNRAALALGRIKNPAAVRPLIDSLVTTHRKKIMTGQPGQMSTSFGSDGTGFGAGGGGIKILKQVTANREVLDALVALTGENFEYNVGAWKRWHAAEQTNAGAVDFRRD